MLRRRRLSSTTIKKKSKHVSNEASDFWADQVLILSKASNKTVLSLPAPGGGGGGGGDSSVVRAPDS